MNSLIARVRNCAITYWEKWNEWYKNKQKIHQKIKVETEKLEEIEYARDELLEKYFSSYQPALCKVEKSESIEGKTIEEFEENYHAAKSEFKKRERIMCYSKYAKIGELGHIVYNTPTYKEGVYLATIEYSEYELEGDISEREYNNIVNTLEEYDKKYKEIQDSIIEMKIKEEV